MKISKNSLLLRMVFYNNIAITLATVTLAILFMIIVFRNMENKIIDSTRDRITLVSRTFNSENLKAKDDLNQIVKNLLYAEEDIFNKNFNYNEKCETIRAKLMAKDIESYIDSQVIIYNTKRNIIGEDSGRNFILSENKIELQENIEEAIINNKSMYFFRCDDNIYTRIILKYISSENELIYIVLTLPLNLRKMEILGKIAELKTDDKLFLVVDGKYNFGMFREFKENLYFMDKHNAIAPLYYKEKINKDTYYIAFSNIFDQNNRHIASIGMGSYYENIENFKIILTLVITILLFIFLGISTTISTKLFKKLLEPLSRIVEAAQEVSKGNYEIFVKPEGVDEMRILSKTFNKMAEDILANERKVKKENIKLSETLKRIDAIEKILLNIQMEEDMNETIKKLMQALTSEMGLGYSRAMYFRYSREIDKMVGELSVINKKFELENDGKSLFENTKGFKFQIEELEKLVKLIKIPFKSENLISQALTEKRVVFSNDKGYKYNLGNELTKSLGIHNFLIIPIFSETRNYGCILVDYFGENKEVTREEVELLTLLFLNISVRIKNKNLEEEKIDLERTATIGKLVDRFFNSRELSFEKMLNFLEKMNAYENNTLLQIQIQELKDEISKLRRERGILNEYVAITDEIPVEIIELEEVINEVYNSVDEKMRELGINLSVFINCSGKILGNKERLKKVFFELIKNAKESFEKKKESTNKKINILVTKEKNIDKIKVVISDNGIGMTGEQLENIFEPFVGYNSNSPGLGLAIVSRIIKDHNGVIKYSSKFGEGTDVKLTFNLYKEENYNE